MNTKKKIMLIKENIPLAPFSSFFVGGSARFFCRIKTQEDLQEALKRGEEKKIPIFVLGGGSNIVFSDKGFEGLVLKMENNAKKQINEQEFWVESGTRNAELYPFLLEKKLDFSEFYTIPGTIGGAVAGNAGLPSKEMKDFVQEAEIFDREKKKFFLVNADFFQFSYRSTHFHDENFAKKYLIWAVKLHFPKAEQEQIRQKAQEMLKKRKEKQPWGKTGGSFFKNPKEGAAGFFLEQAGMKNISVGGAFFSEKHANFMMNDGSATQKDIQNLAMFAQKKVHEMFHIHLIPEVRLISETGKKIEFSPFSSEQEN